MRLLSEPKQNFLIELGKTILINVHGKVRARNSQNVPTTESIVHRRIGPTGFQD